MIISAIKPFQSINHHIPDLLFFTSNPLKLHSKPSPSSLLFASHSSSSSSLHYTNLLTHTTSANNDGDGGDAEEEFTVSSACSVASAIRRASSSPVKFTQRFDNDRNSNLVLPSPDFQSLCFEQLDLFRRVIDPKASLSVYVRPAGSYVMDRLELRRVTGMNEESDIVILIGNFSIPTGLRVAEAALSNLQVIVIPEYKALVFPMVKHPFVVGFLVAELPAMTMETQEHDFMNGLSIEEDYSLPSSSVITSSENQTPKDDPVKLYKFTADQRLNAIHIARTLAMAYVMDQKAMLLQQSSWQNNVRMSNLVEQIRGTLSGIRTLSEMLSTHLKRSEISHDIVEDIQVQGDFMNETLQQLQEAVYMTKANIIRYNEETLKKMQPESTRSLSSFDMPSYGTDEIHNTGERNSLASSTMDLEMPMPPFSLAPLQKHGIRPCNVSDLLAELVGAARPLANKQKRVVELREVGQSLQVAIEEPALRQALSNLIEGAMLRTHVGGKVEIVSTNAPAGGTLVIIDDDGPDMHYMTQMHSLTPFGEDLLLEDMVEDNMTWNFVAGLTVAREILESYGCVIRIISPRVTDAAPLGAGGTRIELWLPSFTL